MWGSMFWIEPIAAFVIALLLALLTRLSIRRLVAVGLVVSIVLWLIISINVLRTEGGDLTNTGYIILWGLFSAFVWACWVGGVLLGGGLTRSRRAA